MLDRHPLTFRGQKKKEKQTQPYPDASRKPNPAPTNDQNRNCRTGRESRSGAASSATVGAPGDWVFGHPSNPFARKGFIPRNVHALVSISYEWRGPRVESSANNNPFRPVDLLLSPSATPCPASCITIRIRASSAWSVYLSVQWSDSSKRSAAWVAIFSFPLLAYLR